MAKRILVLGGTRYFGKKLVRLLLDGGHQVTLGNRGMTADHFGTSVDRLMIDRAKKGTFQKAISSQPWDIVYDQICYSPDEAKISCEVFRNHVGRYIHTSTQSVYQSSGELKENDFDQYTHEIQHGSRTDFSYSDAKRNAEAVYFQTAPFPVVAMRIPIVLGADDYTGRLEFHIDRVIQGKPIVIPNLDAKMSSILSDDVWIAPRTLDSLS